MVYEDFTKALKLYLKKNPDYILIDLIDERYRLLEIDGSLVTCSDEFLNSGLKNSYEFRELSYEEKEFEVMRAIPKFVKLFKRYIDQKRLFLHKAYFVDTYRDEQGNTCHFDEDRNRLSEKLNKTLAIYYELFEKVAGENLIVLQAADTVQLAHSNHTWGLYPVHYIDDYYRDIYGQFGTFTDHDLCHRAG